MILLINKKLEKFKILKEFVAGMVLEGWEVKSLKLLKKTEIKNSYIIIIKKEIFLKNIHICDNYGNNQKRKIKLLLNKKEIKFIKNNIKNFKILLFYIFLLKNMIKAKIIMCSND